MRMRTWLGGALVTISIPAAAAAQHAGHGGGADNGEMARCAQVQPLVQNVIAAASARLESARQSNNPTELRTALAEADRALRDIRAQLEPCAGATSDPHGAASAAGEHAHHGAGSAEGVATRPAGADPHAAHRSAEQTSGRGAADPHAGHAAADDRAPAAAPVDPHAGHHAASSAPVKEQKDPVTGRPVDPATAPHATYGGRTYYFSSEASRKEFLRNPAKFARPRER